MRRVQSSPSHFRARRRSLLGGLVAAFVMALQAAGSSALADEPIPEFRVVVHASNPTRTAERSFLADAFLKKVTRWGEGEAIRPADLRPSAQARRSFTERILKRSVGAVRSYWQQRIFSGRDVPPPELESDEEVLAFVAKHPGAVGYVSGSAKLKGVKELLIK
jgi:ABC-type phosphate transport system substrate-binding protein